MQPFLVALNAFWEDTSVLAVVAYLLTRGALLTLVFSGYDASRRRSGANIVLSGILLGAFGATEYLFPNLRYPYATPTLFITFAAFACGFPVGAMTTAVIFLAAVVAGTPPLLLGMLVGASGASLLFGSSLRRIDGRQANKISPDRQARNTARGSRSLLLALLAGVLSEATALGLRWLLLHFAHVVHDALPHAPTPTYPFVSIPANGVGVALLQLIVREAWERTEAERLRRESAAAYAFAAQQQFAALRARVQPHFLFNTLNSIAALCAISPERAEAATVKLGDVMRRALEAPPHALASLSDEIGDVCAYIEIERYRYEERLNVVWRIAPGAEAVHIPPFALATLVDNAVNHGIAAQHAGGCVVITIRPLVNAPSGGDAARKEHILIAVQDDGVGMSGATRKRAVAVAEAGGTVAVRPHGLPLLDQQLRLLFGERARLRLFSRPDHGTLAVFVVPRQYHFPEALPRKGRERMT